VSPDCPPESAPKPLRPLGITGLITSARRRVAFLATGFFLAADFFFAAGFFFGNAFFFAVSLFGIALLTVFFLAEGALLAADFFWVGFFLLIVFFLRAGFFLAIGKSLPSNFRWHHAWPCFASQILVYTADAKILLQASINNSPPPMFIGFFVFWILLGIGSTAFYYTAAYKTKKFWHPFLTIGSGALFLAFIEFATDGELPVFFVLFLAPHHFLECSQHTLLPKVQQDALWPLVTGQILS
jgi:hypothetical protein